MMRERGKWFLIGALSYQAIQFIVTLATGRTFVELSLLLRSYIHG